MRNKTIKKGALRTMEAFISFIIVMSFILIIMPAITHTPDSSPDKLKYTYTAFKALEKQGLLRQYAYDGNLTGLNESMYALLPPTYNFTVGITSANATHKSVSGNYSFNYTADTGTLEYVFLDVAFTSAQDPKIYVNGTPVLIKSGVVSGTTETVDITSNTVTGNNTVQFNFTSSAAFVYRLIVTKSIDLGSLPQKKDINTVSYIVSGINSTVLPTELRVYLWD